ncbi:MAG: AI-2E family transporter [Bacilli bacterium]|nr:AI-2E family transporter [Bacilli bacterium]
MMDNMDKDKEKKNGKINVRDVNEVVGLSKKILHLVYIMMIIGIIFLGTLIIKEWGILKLIVTLLKVANPFFIGFVLAWLFNPIVVKLENRGWKRGLACITVYLAFIIILFAFFGMLIPTLYNQLNDLVAALPSIFNQVKLWVTNFLDKFNSSEMFNVAEIESNIFKTMENLAGGLANDLPSKIVSIAGSLVSGIGTIGVSLVVGIYLLFDFNDVTDHLLKYIPKSHKEETKNLVDNIANELRKCVNGTLLVAFMVFVCDSIGFAFAGLKSPILFGLLCGITDLIPYIGPYIGGAAAVIVGFSQNPIIGIITLIVATIVQLIENYVLQPVVMSKTMQLHPVTIIIGLLIFGHFFGIAGMILATPILSLFKVLYRFLANKYDWFNKDVF